MRLAQDLLEAGRRKPAARKCREALQAAPAALIPEIAGILHRAGDTAGAHAALRDAYLAHPDDAAIAGAWARALYWAGQYDAAFEPLRQAFDLDPADRDLVFLLADIHIRRDEPARARAVWDRAFAARPRDGRLRLQAAGVFAHFGHPDQARDCLALAEPFFAQDRHEFDVIAAAVRGETLPQQASGYVEALFDRFATNYDEKLQGLKNAGPEAIRDMLKALNLPRGRKLSVLDAGCGTGLCARHLKPYARRLHGIDLSAGMLQKCRDKGQYDSLTRSDLNEAASLPQGPFDLIACADVLVYFGALEPALANMGRLLAPGGWLVLTVEAAPADCPPPGYRLLPSGRYHHTEAYLTDCLRAARLSAPKHIRRATLREEYARPVEGFAVASQKLALFA